jgi:hypothetical protein
VLNKTQMQANKLQFRSPGFEALPGYRRWGDDLLAPDTRRLGPADTGPDAQDSADMSMSRLFDGVGIKLFDGVPGTGSRVL